MEYLWAAKVENIMQISLPVWNVDQLNGQIVWPDNSLLGGRWKLHK